MPALDVIDHAHQDAWVARHTLHAAQVLDCGSFLADYASRAPMMSRPELGEGGNLRPVVDLLVEQLECVPAL